MSVGFPSGWYPDPSGAPQQRYWDGAAWTDHVAPPSGYPPPGFGYAYPPPTAAPGYNGLAIASMILGIMWFYGVGAILALIFSLVAKRQIQERGERGGPMATAGMVLGIIGIVGAIVVFSAAVMTSNSDSGALVFLQG